MAPTFEDIKGFVAPFEGNIPHMYVDTEGYVTVGIGNMLPNVTAARLLAFVNRTTKNAASADEISADFRAVSTQPKAKAARWYRQFTSLDLPDDDVNTLFRARIDDFRAQLIESYPKYGSYPDAAQLAMLDMAFNLGTAGLKKKWPQLNAAIGKLNWATAAEQCVRPQANAVRNAGTQALFRKAADLKP